MDKIFLDTNIVVDFLGEREGFYRSAAQVLTLADKKRIKVFTSPTTISTTFYLLSKYENTKIALEKIRKLKVLCSISMMDDEVIEKAINSDFKDFENALQYFSAVASNCDIILTRNERDFKNALIPVINPKSYLQTLKL
ncbi:MAG: PIN domain-containing protein [Chitinophagales bacterium]|nr:PIN domain-containing protein [Chitinophagales bacterium]